MSYRIIYNPQMSSNLSDLYEVLLSPHQVGKVTPNFEHESEVT